MEIDEGRQIDDSDDDRAVGVDWEGYPVTTAGRLCAVEFWKKGSHEQTAAFAGSTRHRVDGLHVEPRRGLPARMPLADA